MTHIEINSIATNLKPLERGLWITKNKSSKISYPAKGHADCMKIEEESFWFNHRNSCLIEVFKKFPPPGKNIFDIGGGNGYVSLALKKAGFNPILIEPGLQGIQNAQKRGLNPVICSTLEDAGFKKHSLPAVGLFDVLEHVKNDESFLEKIHSLLVKNGRLYITVPAYRFLWSADDDYTGHYRRYGIKELINKLKKTGYTIKFATHFFSFLPFPIFLFRTIPSKLGFRAKKKVVQKNINEHQPNISFLRNILDWYLSKELKKIKRLKKIPFGSSCLIVAEK